MNTGSMSAKTACDVAVIGGGAAGMMAALQAAWAGGRVALLEKNEKLGKKIYITGKGRCNVTNVADIDDFFKQIPRNPRFLNAAARQFTHEDVTGCSKCSAPRPKWNAAAAFFRKATRPAM